MPAAVPAIANFALAATGAYSTLATGIALIGAKIFVYAAGQLLLNRAVQALTPKPKGARGISLELNYSGTAEPRRIIYGYQRVGGMHTIPGFTTGDDGDFLHMILTLAGHQCSDITNAYFDQEQIADADIGAVSGTSSDGIVGAGKYDSRVWIRRYLGTATQTADYILTQAYPTAFTSDFRGRGITYAAIQMKYNKKVFDKGVPQVQFDVFGRLLYDPRLDTTNGGSGSHRYTDPTTWEYSNNPALEVRDYLVNEVGFDNDEIDDSLISAAANVCDQSVSIPGPSTQARYTGNTTLLANVDWWENLAVLVDAMAGRVVYRDGRWRVYAGAWETPTVTINQSDWVSATVTKLSVPRRERWNAVRAWYVDPERNWQRVECFSRRNSGYESDDDDLIWTEIELPAVTNEYLAQRLAEFALRDSRNQVRISGKLRPEFEKLSPWDTVYVNDTDYGWSSKTFRVVSMDVDPDGDVSVALVEQGSAKWTDLDAADYSAIPTGVTIDPGATRPKPPVDLAANTVAGAVALTITPPDDLLDNQRYQIFEGVNSADASVASLAYEGDSTVIQLNRTAGQSRAYWARSIVGSYVSLYYPNTFGVIGTAGSGQAGVPGTYAPFLSLRSNGMNFALSGSYTNVGVSTLDFRVVTVNLAGTAGFHANNYNLAGTVIASYALSGTGNENRGLHVNSFTQAGSTAWAVVTASLSGYFDSITVGRSVNGVQGPEGDPGPTGDDGADGQLGPPGANLVSNGQMTVVDSATGRLASWAGVHGYGAFGPQNQRTMVTSASVTISNTVVIPINGYNDELEISLWGFSVASGGQAYLGLDCLDANGRSIPPEVDDIRAYTRVYSNYTAGVNTIAVYKEGILDQGRDAIVSPTSYNYYLVHDNSLYDSYIEAHPAFAEFGYQSRGWLSINTAVSNSYDIVTLAQPFSRDIAANKAIMRGAIGSTFRYWPDGTYVLIPDSWSRYSYRYRGFGSPLTRQRADSQAFTFRPGTRYVRPIILASYAGGTQYFWNYDIRKRTLIVDTLVTDELMNRGGGMWTYNDRAREMVLQIVPGFPIGEGVVYDSDGGASGFGALIFGTSSYQRVVGAWNDD